jgi:4-aminobutyrate aminotransferase-like enzyme
MGGSEQPASLQAPWIESSWSAIGRKPAAGEAAYVVNRLRDRGILTGTDGPHDNVLKLRPPLVFTEREADLFVTTLDEVLQDDAAQPRSG